MAPNITVTNSNSVSAEIFVNNQAAVRGADIPYTMSGNESQYLTYQSSNYINWGNTVYVCFHKQAQRSYWTYSGFSE